MTDRELLQFLLDVLDNHVEDPRAENLIEKSCKLLRERLAQPEPEPVFYVIQATDRFGEGYEQTYWEDPNGFPVYAAPVHANDISQERVDETAKGEHDIVGACVTCGASHGFWLSAPPSDFISPSVVKAISKREWVGLTEQDVHDAFQFTELVKQLSFYRERPEWCENFASYLEAKLKEKNT